MYAKPKANRARLRLRHSCTILRQRRSRLCDDSSRKSFQDVASGLFCRVGSSNWNRDRRPRLRRAAACVAAPSAEDPGSTTAGRRPRRHVRARARSIILVMMRVGDCDGLSMNRPSCGPQRCHESGGAGAIRSSSEVLAGRSRRDEDAELNLVITAAQFAFTGQPH
jgi:hypothetical protein